MKPVHSPIMMTTHLWILCVRRSFQVYHMVTMGICLYGSDPNMATHMASHLINKAEGCRDPFCSLYKFLEHIPKHIFYDFTCSLSEYALNRALELFRFTRFWHDLFHAIGQKCGMNFKSSRVDGLEGINTEIFEQVNSYLQCIKFIGSHLSQEHFMFFTQFFFYLLNKDKTKKYNWMKAVAAAYQL